MVLTGEKDISLNEWVFKWLWTRKVSNKQLLLLFASVQTVTCKPSRGFSLCGSLRCDSWAMLLEQKQLSLQGEAGCWPAETLGFNSLSNNQGLALKLNLTWISGQPQSESGEGRDRITCLANITLEKTREEAMNCRLMAESTASGDLLICKLYKERENNKCCMLNMIPDTFAHVSCLVSLVCGIYKSYISAKVLE